MSEARLSEHRGWRRWRMDELDDGPRRASPVVDEENEATFDHQSELRALRDKVREEARQEGYRDGFEEGHREGHAQGLDEGRRQGEEETARQRTQTLAPLAELARGFGEALATLDQGVAEDLVELALATGRQLAGDALREQPEQILALIRELIHDEPSLNGKTRLWLHPDDLAVVEQELSAELAAAGWKLHPDDQLSRGGCRVTSPSGELDASWESRWEAISNQVRRRNQPGRDNSGEPTS